MELKVLRIPFLLTAILASILFPKDIAVASDSSIGQSQVAPVANPPWPDRCELKVTIILDHSNSIMEGDPFSPNPTIVHNAAKNLVSTLAGKYAQVSIVSFWRTAETEITLTPLDTAENITAVNDAIDSVQFFTDSPNGSTNWEAAFKEASATASITSDPRKPADAIIIITDGNPTNYGYPEPHGDGAEVDPIDVEGGVSGANVVKGEGTHVIAVGIGDVTEGNLQLISGPNQNEDYFLVSDFDLLDGILQAIATRICAIHIEKTADPELIDSGDPVTYSYLVTNPGDLPVENVSLTDDTCAGIEFVGGDDGDNVLAAEETWEYMCMASLDQDTTNIAIVTGEVDGFPVADQDEAYVDVRPRIQVSKTPNPPVLVEPGGEVEYQIQITNISQEEATLTSLDDDPLGDVIALASSNCELVSLLPGIPYECAFTAQVSGQAGDQVSDTVTATAADDEGNQAQASDTATVEIVAPALDITVQKDNDADRDLSFHDTEQAPFGGATVTFRVSVQNSGEVDVRVNHIADDLHGGDAELVTASSFSPDCADLIGIIIAPQGSATCYFDGVIADMDNLSETDTVQVTVTDVTGTFEVSRADTSTVTTPDILPDISLKKLNDANHDAVFTDDETAPSPGIQVTFQVTITSNSAEILSLTQVNDDLHPFTLADCPTTELPPLGSIVCTYQGTITSEYNAMQVDTASATAEDNDGNSDLAADTSTVRTPSMPKHVGARTQGFWKNHPQAWPVDEITVGGLLYTKDQAIEIMGTPDKGDKTYSMFRQLVAAMLNVMSGTDPTCIAETIDAANLWMAAYGPPGSGVRGNSQAWKEGQPLKDQLDTYNNGLLCAPHQ